MATQAHISTTVLGKTYAGRPMRLAFSLWKLEQEGQAEKARALLAAHNRIRSVFGGGAYDLSADFTDQPMEGWFIVGAGR